MLAATHRFEPATARKDLAGIERIVTAKLAG
jgi:hypothetical protein